MILHVLSLLEKRGLASRVDMQRVLQAVEEQNGVAVDITKM